MKLFLQSLLFFWALTTFVAHAGELENCLGLSERFNSIPVDLKGVSPLRNQDGEWLKEARPFEVAYEPQCNIGDIAVISVMCDNGKSYELISEAKVAYSEDPQGFTIVMISAEDYESLKKVQKKLPFYAQCRSSI